MENEARLAAAIRDVAVHIASRRRAPWRIGWSEAADQFELRLEPSIEAEGGGRVMCEWAVASEGTTGSFEVDFERDDDMTVIVLEEFAERVGDLAAEFWRQPRPWPT